MKTELIVVGRTANKHIEACIADYVSRIAHYMPFSITVIPELRNTRSLTEEQQKQAEGELILKQIQSQDWLILLDERGREPRSIELAAWLEKRRQAVRHLLFVVGGPYGFSPDVYSRANEQLSLSRLTLPHDMVRLLFAEQLYRACTIIKGEPYHHE